MKHHPPITKDSSAKSMWAEIEAMRDEIEQQQRSVNDMRDALSISSNELMALRYQMTIIRSVLASDVQGKP